MTRFVRATAIVAAVVVGAAAFAAGGSTKPKADAAADDRPAIDHYNTGLEHRDAAWRLDEQAAGADPAAAKKLAARIDALFRSAVEEFEAAVAARPDFHEAWSSLGYARRRLGEYRSALTAYDRALAIAPDYAEAIEYRGQAYLQLNRLDDAKQAYTSLSRLAPAQAAVLLAAMERWLAEAEGGAIPPETLESFGTWVRARTAAESGRLRQGW